MTGTEATTTKAVTVATTVAIIGGITAMMTIALTDIKTTCTKPE
jgi:hypothetical protein